MNILSVIIAHPLRKIAGATSAGLQLSEATAEHVELDVAVMWDRDEISISGDMAVHYVRCTNRLGPLASLAPRFVRIPLYDSRIPEMILGGNYDIVHLHNLVPAFAAERVARACRRSKIPYVISTHGFYEQTRYAEINGFGRFKSLLADYGMTRPFKRIVAGAAGIFALSDCERDLLADLGVHDDRIRVVTNGVNEFYLETPPPGEVANVRAKFGVRNDVPVLLFAGSLHAYKGVGIFLKALKQLNTPFQAVVVGSFKSPEEQRSVIEKAGVDADLVKQIVFTGYVSNNELRALNYAADLFVYPTMGDTLPLAVLEAMATGLPVISTTIGGLPFMVPPECGILVPPGDADSVAEAVKAMLASPQRRRAAGARARARVLETFRWAASAKEAAAGYRAILAGKRASADIEDGRGPDLASSGPRVLHARSGR